MRHPRTRTPKIPHCRQKRCGTFLRQQTSNRSPHKLSDFNTPARRKLWFFPSSIVHRPSSLFHVYLYALRTLNSALFLFLLLFFGCATGRVSIPDAPAFNSPAELIHILTARQTHLKDQRVRAQVSLRIDGVSERRATALLQYRAPDDLKIDIGTLGMSIMSASAADDTLRVFLPRDNHYLQGAPAQVLETLTGVNLSYYDIYHAIFGLPNLSEIDAVRVTRYVPGERVLIELQHPLWTRRLWLEQRTATLLEEHVFAPDGQRLSKRLLSDYRVESGFLLPRRIEIHQGEDFIQIDVQSRTINTGLSDADFFLRVPGDVTRHEIK